MQSIKNSVSKIQTKLPTRLKSKSRKNKEDEDPTVGSVSVDLEVPTASDIVFRETWQIRKFHRTIAKRDFADSPVFRCSVNGLTTYWNVSIRFWKGPNGKKVTNPVVICLNLNGCETEEMGQARVRFQFGVWDASIRHWECCPISDVVFNLNNTQELLSVGYKSLGILDRHINNAKDVSIMVKLQIIQSDESVHSLGQDLARMFTREAGEVVDTWVACSPDPERLERQASSTEDDVASTGSSSGVGSTGSVSETVSMGCGGEGDGGVKWKVVHAHSFMVKARSMVLGAMMTDYKTEKNKNIKYKLDLRELPYSLVKELLRYVYTDKVDNADIHSSKLLPLAVKFCMPGLKSLCERHLLETITPTTVGNILLLADQCRCPALKRAALRYCEDSETIKGSVAIGKTLAWRVMEMVNPDLFLEACESIASSSGNEDTHGSYSD